ncbi:MAG: DUF4405 domain-containing protein [Oscillospiraceae bacterium]|nr:DUF4405 domain-containing protein [Oscillospiraceae bacterium]
MKQKIKILIDVLMTVLLLALMAYQVVGDVLHEWFGTGMLVLFIVHNILNYKWYASLFKGKYKPQRVFSVLVNIAVLAAMLSLGYSGIVMSRNVFAFLHIGNGMALARSMHLAVSYWGFVLMSLHLGLHWGMIIGLFRKLTKGKAPAVVVWVMRVIAAAIAVFGAILFIKADIFSYMFLKNDFAFFDFDKSAFAVFAEYIVMMGTWVFIGYYITKILRLFSKKPDVVTERNEIDP